MNRLVPVFCTVFMLIVGVVTAQELTPVALSDLGWLAGKWDAENVGPGQQGFEVWDEPVMDKMKGIGFTIQGSDTVFIEKLALIKKDDALYYVADVSHNPEPVFFRITSATENAFVCENPGHDFPQRIEYTLRGDSLEVVISAGEKSMGFAFKRVE